MSKNISKVIFVYWKDELCDDENAFAYNCFYRVEFYV